MRYSFIIALLLLSLTACGSDFGQADPTETPIPNTPTAIAAIQPTPIPTVAGEGGEGQPLVLWWPDVLAPGERPEVNDVLNQQINSFVLAEENAVQIDFRTKRYGAEEGGIMPTLRAASEVAPGALPDLTLIRRSDLTAAASVGIIYPLDGTVNASIIGDLYRSALRLGQVNGLLYGLPYMLDVQHIAYRPGVLDQSLPLEMSFSQTIARGIVWVLPARHVNDVSRTFYAEYIDAGGDLPNDDGTITLNADALLAVLQFYEEAVSAGLIDESSLEYSSSTDYSATLALGELDAAIVSSDLFISETRAGRQLVAASIPTLSGKPTGMVNGWMWVITTSDPERQALVARFLNWMMDVSRQSDFADVIYMLPSQRSALQSLSPAHLPISTYDDILNGAVIPPLDSFNTVSARTLQAAFIGVLSGEIDAETAVENVQSQLTGEG